MGILNIGTRALQANSVALQTAGNNIANVNTAGYSRQNVVLETVQGQYTGGGYIGKGVGIQTIQRNFSDFLTRQATMASATQSGDKIRSDKLAQLENIFPGGTSGLGAAVNDMLNAFSDVATAPTDLTARTVALTRVDETAARMRSASQNMDDLQFSITQELEQKVKAVNGLAQSIADVNAQIAKATGSGQPPNDLLDRRDQLIRDLNQYVQTTSIAADDGTVGVFIGGSQALVLGTSASSVSMVADAFGVQSQKLAINRNGVSISLDENALGGGEIPGLLRFQNTDMNEARNLLGRFTLAISDSMNKQHALGLDMSGNVGGNMFTPADLSKVVLPSTSNPVPAVATLTVSINNASNFQASDYKVTFASPATVPVTGTWTRLSDAVPNPVAFTLPALPGVQSLTFDGLTISIAGTAAAGDDFLIKPFSTSASTIKAAFSSPQSLAVASPVAGRMGAANTGSLQLAALTPRTNPPTNVPVVITFTSSTTYTRSDYVGALSPFTYTPGQDIEGSVPATSPLSQWTVNLLGAPKAGDTFTVVAQPAANRNLNAGNATAMMNLRDVKLFDGGALTDGYAGLIAQVGVRAQSANYATETSSSIANSLEAARTSVSGVNLDEEAAKLLQFQQAYQASAKMIQIAQSIFDTLLQSLGR